MKEKIIIDIEYAKELFDSGISMHKISDILGCSFTKVQKELNSYEFNLNNPYKKIDGKNLIAVCKKTGKEIFDYDNRSGSITTHLLELFPDLEIPSHYKRKDILYKTFKYWYDDYFDFIYRDVKSVKKCVYCEWETEDINNLSGAYMNHMVNVHNIDIGNHLDVYPDDSLFFKNFKKLNDRKKILQDEYNYVICKECGEKMNTITISHLNKHNITIDEYRIKHNMHDSEFMMSKKNNDEIKERRKTTFKPKKIHKRSKAENKIIEFLNSYEIKTINNERNVLKGFELDIYLPEYKIGIEHNGTYFHSENTGGKDKNYHKSKTNILESHGIKLIHIFDFNYILEEDKINNMLLDFIGINNILVKKDYILIKHINEKDKNSFIKDNSINILDRSKYCIGALNDTILSIICFDYDGHNVIINNYVNKINYRIEDDYLLFLDFIKYNFNFNNIIGYYDKLWNNYNNNIFEKLGFIKNRNTEPDFYYVKYNGLDKGKLINKNLYKREDLKIRFKDIYSDNLSNNEILLKTGHDRVWDSGKIEYYYNINKITDKYVLESIVPNNYNRKNIPKYKENIKNKPKKPSRKVVLLDSKNNFIKIYNSIKDCSNHIGYGFSQIYDRLRGKYKNNLPYKFIYLKDYKEDYDLEIDLHKNSEDD